MKQDSVKDVIIIGGGMIGSAVAVGLSKLGLQVALLEKNPLPIFEPQSEYDLRISAISITSVKLLESLGAWQAIKAMRVCPYDGLETWEIDGFDTVFHAQDLGLNELGYMVENNIVQISLWEQLKAYPNCTTVLGFQQLSAHKENDLWTITTDEDTFSAPLIIAADGANSLARHWAGIGLTSWQYRQSCLLATVKTELPQQSVTWQQFFQSGPRAFLPLTGNNGCIVWYDSPQRIQQLNQLSPPKLTAEIQQAFPARLGQIEAIKSGCFPLTRQHAQHYFRQGVLLVGDAAHTINPLAGQGVNLGFKDVKVLLDIAEQAVKKGENLASESLWKRYELQRKPDNLMMQTGMDVFYKTFKTDLFPVKVLRNAGLVLAQQLTPLKKKALKYAIGL